MSEEEPGKILHEVRLDVSSGLALGGKSAYYGSVDATPLFVIVLGEVSRWGFAADTIAALLPHADRALDWIRDYGDSDGDGFVEYARLNEQGPDQPGLEGLLGRHQFRRRPHGRAADRVVRGAGLRVRRLLARVWMAYDAGDEALAIRPRDRAARLKKQFNEQFWLPERGYYAIALDGTSVRSMPAPPTWATACGPASWTRTRRRWSRNG